MEREGERRRREGEAGSEREKELLERLGKEAGQWAEQAELLMTQVLREEEKEKKMEEPRTSDSSLKVSSGHCFPFVCDFMLPVKVYFVSSGICNDELYNSQ